MRQGRTLIVGLAAVMAVVVCYVVLLGPQRSDRRRLGEQMVAAERQEQELRSTLTRLRRLAAERGAHEAQLEDLRRLVPAEPDVAGFILAANDAAVRSGVDWVSLSPTSPTAGPAGGPAAIPVNIAVNGGFFTVVDYLRRLENLGRLVAVDSLQLSSGAPAGGALQLSVTMSARIFTTAPALGAPGSPAAAPVQSSASAGTARG